MKKALFWSALVAASLVFTQAALAIDADERPITEPIVEPEPEAPALDTALVFTNVSGRAAAVKFEAFDEWGGSLGTGELEVPARGLVYVLASRIGNAAGVEGFVGHVQAKARGRVVGSTVVLGGVLSDIDTINHSRRIRKATDDDTAEALDQGYRVVSYITFPVVATQ